VRQVQPGNPSKPDAITAVEGAWLAVENDLSHLHSPEVVPPGVGTSLRASGGAVLEAAASPMLRAGAEARRLGLAHIPKEKQPQRKNFGAVRTLALIWNADIIMFPVSSSAPSHTFNERRL